MESVRDRFAAELSTYAAGLAKWLEAGHDGEWVVILKEEAVGPFKTHGDAWRGGIERFGVPGFMIQQIDGDPRPMIITPIFWKRPSQAS